MAKAKFDFTLFSFLEKQYRTRDITCYDVNGKLATISLGDIAFSDDAEAFETFSNAKLLAHVAENLGQHFSLSKPKKR
jgi:hypothetical protein